MLIGIKAQLLASGHYQISPFRLANAGYQGWYSDVRLENGIRMGEAAFFCINVRRYSTQVSFALMNIALEKGKLKFKEEYEKDNYVRNLEWFLDDICRQSR